MTPTDYVTGNRGQSRGFRLDRNRTLHPDQGPDIYIYIHTHIYIYVYDRFMRGQQKR